ncbi:carbohydrate esterase family 9 protein [Zasmidium cellare ATCC 36951]|uniref:N-acetylglucosamine-6-phosphate deacetylase n=1 Tax=Zasmidium cellare ATCC 36951 TaxID=1080233 RepID=A0A6A6CZ93_ZASCE|nr:carbohydrate esterase family 9 protein [Zasmidium cellare ATCC 36951]KAF2172547.1 carbohydrate esterase family 9 protein [Zasmidium cellare ATCC 36951]
MPLLHSEAGVRTPSPRFARFSNGRIVRGNQLISETLWIDTDSGRVCEPPSNPDSNEDVDVVDLQGKILAPGFIDIQINGAFGFDFSDSSCVTAPQKFQKGLHDLNQRLLETGTTSYLPTMTSQFAKTYHHALPFLRPTGSDRDPSKGAESLGAHCEGPFFAHTQKGCHSPEAILAYKTSEPELLKGVYGEVNLLTTEVNPAGHVRMITLAPERAGALDSIKTFSEQGIIMSIGHTAATYAEAVKGVQAGAKTVTHLYNAMNQLHHREPGIFGLIASSKDRVFDQRTDLADDGRPYFGIIADGIHLHPSSLRLAYNAHPEGLILITDAVMFMGMEDGTYEWTNGQRTVKQGLTLQLEGTKTLAGSAIDLLSCVNNLLRWAGCSVPEALRAVTTTPATLLGLQGIKGSTEPGADADLVVSTEKRDARGLTTLQVSEVWKFGKRVHVCGRK